MDIHDTLNRLALRAIRTAITQKDIQGATELLKVIYPAIMGQQTATSEHIAVIGQLLDRVNAIEVIQHNQQAFRDLSNQ